jgi:hypothetical protein
MKKNKKLFILFVALAVVAAWFVITKSKGTIKPTLRDFAVQDTASVNKIFLADKSGNNITLERSTTDGWMVNGKFNVRPDAIKVLLTTIKKIDVKEPVGKNAQDNVIKRLATKAVRCEIYQNNELVKAYYVGTETADQTGTYMILIDPETMAPSAKAFITYIPGFEGYLTTRYFTDERNWRDRTVFAYVPSEIKSVKMESPEHPEQSYEVTAQGGNSFQVKMLATNKPVNRMDTMAVKQYLSYFKQLNFESFETELKPNQIDSILRSQPINILTVTDASGKANKVSFYTRPNLKKVLDEKENPLPFDPVRMDAQMNDGKDFVMLQYFVFGKVLPPVEYFSKKY